jgi:predicted peptidase
MRIKTIAGKGRSVSIAVILACMLGIGCTPKPTGQLYHAEEKGESDIGYTHYLLYLPHRYYRQRDAEWPLIVYLHGYYDINNLTSMMDGSIPGLLAKKNDLPFVVASPHMVRTEAWNPEKIRRFVLFVCKEYRIDKNRMYLTGISWGGKGTLETLITYPDFFAAAAPLCCYGLSPAMYQEYTSKLSHVPIWVFHGALDSPSVVKGLVDALADSGAEVRFTLYPDLGHEIWDQTYSNPELYEWFLEYSNQRRK